ncbi:MAG TPA: ABC transporter substrate-binding protein [Usitatibacter sp.]|nr:ABC transporter substrate-binding protein [Usitatibacter sp.]
MRRTFLLLAGLALASCAMTPSVDSDLRREFAPTGVLRAGVNFGNPVIAQKDLGGGAPRGVGPDLARALAESLGVGIAYVTYDTAGKMADAVKEGAWDVAMLADDPLRANEIAFSKPYVQIEGTYMVRGASPLKRIDDFDRAGVKIAVGNKTAYDLYLSRTLKHAELVRAPTSIAAVELFRAQDLDAVAGVKNPLVAAAAKDPSLRVIEGNFMVIGQAAGVPRAREHAARYLREFIEEKKRSGFVAAALKRSGVTDATVAP